MTRQQSCIGMCRLMRYPTATDLFAGYTRRPTSSTRCSTQVAAAPSLPAAAPGAAQAHARGAVAQQAAGGPDLLQPGHHLHRLRPERRHRADLPARPAAADHLGRRLGRDRARPDPAHHRAQPVPQGPLSRAAHPAATAWCRGEVIYTCRHFRRQMTGVKVPRDAYVNVMGTDLVRLPDGQFVVLEDNLRVPSGVSYMLSSRKVMKQIFPALFRKYGVRPIEQYSQVLLSTLRSLAPDGRDDPDDRPADAGRLQLGLLRARVPGAPDGHRAGRRARPRRPRQHRLHADDQGAAAGRRDLPARRRRLPRSAGVPRRLVARRRPGCSAPTAPATSRSPTRSAPASPTTRRSTPTCRRSSGTTSIRIRSSPTSRRC